MPFRSWAPWLLVLAVGCATSDDARPAKTANTAKKATKAKEAQAAPVADEDDDSPEPPASVAKGDERDKKTGEPDASAPPAAAAETPPRAPPHVDPAPDAPKRTAADPFGDVGFKEVDQKDWLASLREKIAQQEKVPPTDLRVSPGLLRAAYVRSPPVVPVKPGRRAPPRRHEIVVVDNQGRRLATFRAVAAKRGDEPPKDLRFLSEERLVYEVVEPPPEPPPPGKPAPHKPPPRPAHGKKATPKLDRLDKATKAAAPKAAVAPPPRPIPPLPPPRTFVIQPIAPRARPLKCIGVHFTFSRDRDKLAFVSGTAEAGFVAVDGAQVYPRRGRTIVASAPAWSKDGRSLAFLEARATLPTRLVLLAELDNPTGDTTWDLPPSTNTDGALVFWAGSGKLVVGKTQMRPIFSASFTKEMPGH